MGSLGRMIVRRGLMKAPANDLKAGVKPVKTFEAKSRTAKVEDFAEDLYTPETPGKNYSWSGGMQFQHANANKAYEFPFKGNPNKAQQDKAISILADLVEQGDKTKLDEFSKKVFGMSWKKAKLHPSLVDFA